VVGSRQPRRWQQQQQQQQQEQQQEAQGSEQLSGDADLAADTMAQRRMVKE
jgi:hypothetical protein